MKAPIVEISDMKFSESNYVDTWGSSWSACKLYEYAKEQNYEVFDMPLACADLSGMPFKVETLNMFIFQCSRVSKTDKDKPILIDDNGYVCDGWHRICKAILDGDTHIKAIRLQTMPRPDNAE